MRWPETGAYQLGHESLGAVQLLLEFAEAERRRLYCPLNTGFSGPNRTKLSFQKHRSQ